MYKGLYVYPWDLAGQGLEPALGRIRATGINTITLAATADAGACLRPPGRTGEAVDAAPGTVCFRARPERYGHMRPRVHAMTQEFDAFAELQRVAPDLRRAAWVACWRSPRGDEHPQYASQNALGDPCSSSLCPAHPAVRDYVVNLCADMAHGYDLAAVVLEAPGWLPWDHARDRGFAKAPRDRFARTLLSLCFADATRHAARAAGIDAERLQAKARALLERHLAAELAVPDALAAAWWSAEMVSDPEWAAFLNWRCRQIADLVVAVKSALPAGTALALIPSGRQRGATGWLEGSDLAMLAGAADALEVPVDQAPDVDLYLATWDVRRRAGEEAVLRFLFGLGDPERTAGRQLVEAALKAKQVGISGIAFHGPIGHGSLGRIKAALTALER